jgi:hypothetical protein
MADEAIVASAIAAAPFGYTVPGAQEIAPKLVSATFDCTSAASTVYPALQLVSPSGVVMGTFVDPNVSIAAGGSADVSWFPRVRPSSSGGGGLDPDWGTYFMNSISVGSGAHDAGQWNFNSGSALLSISGLGVATTVSRAVYQFTAWIQSDDLWTAGAVAGGRIVVGNPTNYTQRQTGPVTPAGSMKNFAVTLTAEINAGEEIDVEFENFDTASRNMYSNQILVQLIGTF